MDFFNNWSVNPLSYFQPVWRTVPSAVITLTLSQMHDGAGSIFYSIYSLRRDHITISGKLFSPPFADYDMGWCLSRWWTRDYPSILIKHLTLTFSDLSRCASVVHNRSVSWGTLFWTIHPQVVNDPLGDSDCRFSGFILRLLRWFVSVGWLASMDWPGHCFKICLNAHANLISPHFWAEKKSAAGW